MKQSTKSPQSLPTPDFNQLNDYQAVPTTIISWNLVTFFKKSILLVKNHPKLLILGVALTVFSASGVSSNQSSFQNLIKNGTEKTQPEIDQKIQQKFGFNEINLDFEKLEEGLVKDISTATENQKSDGEQTNSDIGTITNLFNLEQNLMNEESQNLDSLGSLNLLDPAQAQSSLTTLFLKFTTTLKIANRRLPGWVYSFFGLEILLALILGISFSFIVSAWAQAAVIGGIRQADLADQAGKNASDWQLVKVSQKAFTHIKAVIWLNIFPWLKLAIQFIGLLIAIVLATGSSSLIVNNNPNIRIVVSIIVGIGIVISVIWFALRAIKTLFAIVLGQRQLVFNNLKAKPAFEQGWLLLKGNYWKMYWLLIANSFFNLLINLIVIAPIMAVVIGFVAKNWETNTLAQLGQNINIGWIIAAASTALFATVASTFVKVVLQIISNANWHWAYQVLTAKRNQYEK